MDALRIAVMLGGVPNVLTGRSTRARRDGVVCAMSKSLQLISQPMPELEQWSALIGSRSVPRMAGESVGGRADGKIEPSLCLFYSSWIHYDTGVNDAVE